MIEEPFRSFVCTPEIKTKSILKPIKVVCVEKTHGLLLFSVFFWERYHVDAMCNS